MNQPNVSTLPHIMRLPEVVNTVGLSRPSIYRLIKERAFPAQVPLGTSSVGWMRSEVEAWIAQRVSARDARLQEAPLAA